MEEIWKDIKGYEGLYQASNLGRIKSLSRWIRNSPNGGMMLTKDRIIKQIIDTRGYFCVNIYKETKRKKMSVHQLIAMAFLDHVPNGYKVVVDHVDNDKLNNKLENLQLTTNRHNSSKDKTGGSSKYVGVSWSKANRKWHTRIRVNGKKEHLGYFQNEIDAHNAYQNKLKEIIT